MSVFFIPERSILCERLLKQVSGLLDRHLRPAADGRRKAHGREYAMLIVVECIARLLI